MGPVWEANHVWLIFVLVVCWTAYPTAFGVDRLDARRPALHRGGRDHPARHGLRAARGSRRRRPSAGASTLVFALSSILDAVRARRRDRRDRLGPRAGRERRGRRSSRAGSTRPRCSSACSPSPCAAYLAAVYLAADAGGMDLTDAGRGVPRAGAGDRRRRGRRRARRAWLVVRDDARPIWDGLTGGAGLGAVAVSACAGAATMVLVWTRRYGPARCDRRHRGRRRPRRLGARAAARAAARAHDPRGRRRALDARRARRSRRDRRACCSSRRSRSSTACCCAAGSTPRPVTCAGRGRGRRAPSGRSCCRSPRRCSASARC